MPEWTHGIRNRLESLHLAPIREFEIVEEVSQHLEECYQGHLAGGATEQEAYQATIEETKDLESFIEGVEHLEHFENLEPLIPDKKGQGGIMSRLRQDVRFAARTLSKNPAFTIIAVFTLALGIGPNTALFSIVNAVLLRPLPFRDSARLVQLWETGTSPGRYPLAGPDYLDWQAQSRALESTSLYSWPESVNVSSAGESEQSGVIRTQANFFQVLGGLPLIGRTFVKGEDQPGKNHVVVLSHGFWQQHFGGEQDILGVRTHLRT